MEANIISLVQKVVRKFRVIESVDEKLINLFKQKKGIEIGGPSPIFSSELPIYPIIESLDGCNFSNNTVWEGSILEGENYSFFSDKKGFQYIAEASDLNKVDSNKYDFLLASHCLEHCANSLKTIEEWLRVIKPGGIMLLILPKKENTFDHKRQITSFEHLLADYANDVDETDLTHLEEIIAYHDLVLDIPAGDNESFKCRSLNNYQNRCLHHHVYDFELLNQIFDYTNTKVIYQEYKDPYHQIIAGIKS
ncbi:methyltransferase domain-containing protein [Pontibacter pamirensis]|uniref:methyltransferase domain-containing protein n=1 Tax=Pontibacter pamirensis TaxID=2562824 RepID=UPI0013899090|nr:methyltransferase domain-containing protein [Pontibacter pamirensis]